MRFYSPVDLTGNLIMIEKLVSDGTWTGDLPSMYAIFEQARSLNSRITPLHKKIAWKHADSSRLKQSSRNVNYNPEKFIWELSSIYF